MANTVDKVLNIALAEEGYLEKSASAYKADPSVLDRKTDGAGYDNYTKYGRDMHAVYPAVMDFPAAWCDAFTDWCFYKAYGVSTAKSLLCGNFDDYTVNSAKKYEEKGALDTTPSVGAQIFFTKNGKPSGCYHTGLVYQIDDTYIYTIEGNTSAGTGVVANGGSVAKKKYVTKNQVGKVLFGHPKYDASVYTTDNAVTIWKYLKNKGLNDYAVAGLMGNLYAESGLNPKNLQNSANKRLGLSDDEYTAAVDNGTYKNFTSDKAGYGLAQWTYSARKKNLAAFVRAKGCSIGDLAVQLEFLWEELCGYKGVMESLKTAKSVREASDAVLLGYEKPKDQSDKVKETRASYGQRYFDKYAGKTIPLYTVIVNTGKLNVRKGPGLTYASLGTVQNGEQYAIVEESVDDRGKKWGRLEAINGWISLTYTRR